MVLSKWRQCSIFGTTALYKNCILRSPGNNLTITLKKTDTILHIIWLRWKFVTEYQQKVATITGLLIKNLQWFDLIWFFQDRILYVLSEARGDSFRPNSIKQMTTEIYQILDDFECLRNLLEINQPIWYVLQIFVNVVDYENHQIWSNVSDMLWHSTLDNIAR